MTSVFLRRIIVGNWLLCAATLRSEADAVFSAGEKVTKRWRRWATEEHFVRELKNMMHSIWYVNYWMSGRGLILMTARLKKIFGKREAAIFCSILKRLSLLGIKRVHFSSTAAAAATNSCFYRISPLCRKAKDKISTRAHCSAAVFEAGYFRGVEITLARKDSQCWSIFAPLFIRVQLSFFLRTSKEGLGLVKMREMLRNKSLSSSI